MTARTVHLASESTARQLSLLDEVRTPDIRFDAPVAPGSESSRRAAELVTDSPFRRASWRRILFTLAALPAGRCLSREEIAERVGVKEGPLCARLSELAPFWIEVIQDDRISSAGVRVNGYRLTSAGRASCSAYTPMEQTKR